MLLLIIGVAGFWFGFLSDEAPHSCCGDLLYIKRQAYTYLVCVGVLGLFWLNAVFPVSAKLIDRDFSVRKWVFLNIIFLYIISLLGSFSIFYFMNSNTDIMMKVQLSMLGSFGFTLYLLVVVAPIGALWAVLNIKPHNKNRQGDAKDARLL